MKKIRFAIVFLITLFIFTSVGAYSYQTTNYKLYVDGNKITTDTGLYEVDGVMCAPVRALGEGLNTIAEYDVSTNSIIYRKNDLVLVMQIDNDVMFLNGEPIKLNIPAHVSSGRTLVPIEDVAKCFGYNYLVYPNRGIVSVYSSPNAPNIFVEPEILSCPTRYHRNSGEPFVIDVSLNDGNLLKILVDELELSENKFNFDGTNLTIYNSALDSLNVGTHQVALCFQNNFILKTNILFIDPNSNGEYTVNLKNYKLYFDGKEIKTTGLYEVGGVICSPVRALGEGLNTIVEYDVSTNSIIYRKNDLVLVMQIDNDVMFLNGEPIKLKIPIHTSSDGTIVPIEDVAKCFGYNYLVYPNRELVSVFSSPNAPNIFVEPQILSCPARYHRNSGDTFTMRIDINDGNFSGVLIDGCGLSAEKYTFDGENLIIDKTTLNLLDVANHKITLCFQNDFTLTKNFLVIDKNSHGDYVVYLKDYKFYVDGEEIAVDVGLYEIGGMIFAPLRTLAEGLDTYISWNDSTEAATFEKDGNELIVPIYSQQFIFNGQAVTVSIPAHVSSGRTLVPIEDVAKCFGYRYTVDRNASIIKVDSEQFAIYSVDDFKKLLNDEAITIKLKYRNNKYNSVVIYIGFYNSNNGLEKLERYLCDVNIGNDEILLNIPSKATNNNISNAKIFVWDDIINPLSYKTTISKDGYLFF